MKLRTSVAIYVIAVLFDLAHASSLMESVAKNVMNQQASEKYRYHDHEHEEEY
jgi:hypothetical protein